jgi:hypothetical protein
MEATTKYIAKMLHDKQFFQLERNAVFCQITLLGVLQGGRPAYILRFICFLFNQHASME